MSSAVVVCRLLTILRGALTLHRARLTMTPISSLMQPTEMCMGLALWQYCMSRLSSISTEARSATSGSQSGSCVITSCRRSSLTCQLLPANLLVCTSSGVALRNETRALRMRLAAQSLQGIMHNDSDWSSKRHHSAPEPPQHHHLLPLE